MSNRVLTGGAVAQRYQYNQGNLITLRVTRQGQQFVLRNDDQHCDLELVQSSVQLVGEPGTGNRGFVNSGYGVYYDPNAVIPPGEPNAGDPDPRPFEVDRGYMNTINNLPLNASDGMLYSLYGESTGNGIRLGPEVDHSWVSVSIENMTESRHFQQDEKKQDNDISLAIPTDLGILARRDALNSSERSLNLENVRLRERITVNTEFFGTQARSLRKARFVEDIADEYPVLFREGGTLDGDVKFFDDQTEGSASVCNIPSNCIVSMLLIFKVRQRVEV